MLLDEEWRWWIWCMARFINNPQFNGSEYQIVEPKSFFVTQIIFLPPSIESRYKAADRQEFENFSFQTNDTQLNGHGGAQKPSVSLYTQASIWIRPSQRFQRFHCHQRIIFLDDGTFFLSNLCNNRNFINHEDGIQERILQDVLQYIIFSE